MARPGAGQSVAGAREFVHLRVAYARARGKARARAPQVTALSVLHRARAVEAHSASSLRLATTWLYCLRLASIARVIVE